MAKQMTAKQLKYFGKGHGKSSIAKKTTAKVPTGKRGKMPMVNGKPAQLTKK